MAKYHPAGEDGPTAMMAQAAHERREHPQDDSHIYPRGWPGPMKWWDIHMRDRFTQTEKQALAQGYRKSEAFAEAYHAVLLMGKHGAWSVPGAEPLADPVQRRPGPPRRTPAIATTPSRGWHRNGPVVRL